MNPVTLVQNAMLAYYTGDARRINHFIKVYGFAKAIGESEGLDAQAQLTLEIAALTHDIGIRVSEQKYNSSSGHYQQIEGPGEARLLLGVMPIAPAVIKRVCWLIAHHHTYTNIQGLDYQILVEADFLVNIGEDALSPTAIDSIETQIFKTATGAVYLRQLYPATL